MPRQASTLARPESSVVAEDETPVTDATPERPIVRRRPRRTPAEMAAAREQMITQPIRRRRPRRTAAEMAAARSDGNGGFDGRAHDLHQYRIEVESVRMVQATNVKAAIQKATGGRAEVDIKRIERVS